MKKLVDDLRPKKFEDVRGQISAVRFLSRLIVNGQRERNILLHGQVGSGKTTLARIYAAALNCEAYNRKTGSPCGCCDPCKRTEAHDPALFLELTGPDLRSADHISEIIDSVIREPSQGVRRIIFIDEAHALATVDKAVVRLLKPIEDARDGIVYILATSELDEVPAALRSRFILLAIRPLSREDSYRFMTDVLSNHDGPKPAKSALDLIAGFSDYQPRNMLHCLDQLLPDPITVDRVRQVFGSPDIELLVGYFDCLALGNSEAALIAFLEWPETTPIKVGLIRSMLLHIFLRHFCQMDVVIDPLIASIKTTAISNIVTKHCHRVCAMKLDPTAVWRDMISFWRKVPRDRDDEASMLDIALFHHAICDLELSASVHPIKGEQAISSTSRERSKYDPWGPRPRAHPRPKLQLSETHLHYEHVRDIVNTASACTQAYNVRFNAKVTLWHSHFAHDTREAASTWMSHFTKEMREWIGRRDAEKPVCRITTQERDPERGHCARTIVHLPEAYWDDFRSWCQNWSQEKRVAAMAGKAIEIELPAETPKSVTSRETRHKACIRWLLASTDPKEEAWDLRYAQPKIESLRTLLGLDSEVRRLASVGKGQRLHTESASLTEPGLLRQTRYRMFFLSAFDDGAWNLWTGAWERHEHESRRVEMQKRNREWREAMSISGSGPIPDRALETEEARALYHSWPENPRLRPRLWDVWWPQDEL